MNNIINLFLSQIYLTYMNLIVQGRVLVHWFCFLFRFSLTGIIPFILLIGLNTKIYQQIKDLNRHTPSSRSQLTFLIIQIVDHWCNGFANSFSKSQRKSFFVRLDLVSKRREVRHTQVSLAIAGGEGGGVTVHRLYFCNFIYFPAESECLVFLVSHSVRWIPNVWELRQAGQDMVSLRGASAVSHAKMVTDLKLIELWDSKQLTWQTV